MKRVLIIKTSSMGDIVHNLPVVADIRRAHPALEIDWVVEEGYADLVRMARGVARVIPVAHRRWRREPYHRRTQGERLAFFRDLRFERYDVVLDTQGLLKSAWIAQRARLAPKGVRVGFSFGLVREGLARLFYDRAYAVDPRLHAIERMRALAASTFNYSQPNGSPRELPRFELEVPPKRFDWLEAGTPGNGSANGSEPPGPKRYAVLLHATARTEKAWPSERWTALIAILCRAGITPVLPSGNAAELDAATNLARDASASLGPSDTQPLVAPSVTLVEAAALLGGAYAIVGVDTGLLHLAAALEVPTVGLFGATPRWRYAPYWSPHAINLGSFGELGAQPGVSAVVDSLERLGILEAGSSADAAARYPVVPRASSSREERAS